MSLKKKLEGKTFDYVNNNLLPSAYEVLTEAVKAGEEISYEAFNARVLEKMKGEPTE